MEMLLDSTKYGLMNGDIALKYEGQVGWSMKSVYFMYIQTNIMRCPQALV